MSAVAVRRRAGRVRVGRVLTAPGGETVRRAEQSRLCPTRRNMPRVCGVGIVSRTVGSS